MRTLLIVSHVIHYRFEGGLYAYGPYAREIDLWAQLFPEVVIASPCREEPPTPECLAFTQTNISIRPQAEGGGHTPGAKIRLGLQLPKMLWSLSREMRRADAIHVRCPGNLGLLGALLAPFHSRFLVAKYAAQWAGGGMGDGLSTRFQRALLRSRWWRGPVTVYGRWPDQPAHVVPFFTSLLSSEQMERARRAASSRRNGPLHVLYTGRLSKAKNVDILLAAMARVRRQGFELRGTIVGAGPEKTALEADCKRLGLDDCVAFTGGMEFDEVLDHLESAHVLVLASQTEGWPKSIAEAMAFGLICIGSDLGLIPEMLGEGRGFLVPPRDVEALAEALSRVAANPAGYGPMRQASAEWAQRYSLEGLKDALKALLEQHWKLSFPLDGLDCATVARMDMPCVADES
jgi:glycosyltransferase involved in cell wall biosynthesis